MQVNQEAVQHARELVEQGKYITDSDWRKDQPSVDEENYFLEKHGWHEYSKWYLGLDANEHVHAKGHYTFPFGDFKKVHRAGLIAARQRAGQYQYDEIEKAAGMLLEMIDEREAEKA
jgi:hypothetical protein